MNPEFERENTDETFAIAKEILKIKELIAELAPAVAKANEAKEGIETSIKDKRKEIDELVQKRNEIETQVWETRQALKRAEKAAEQKERELVQAAARQRLAEQLDDLSRELDEFTKSAEWRKFAFPHQISGAKKLAAIGLVETQGGDKLNTGSRGILADKMGLGKSLTSLIWLDFVKARRVLAIVPNETQINFMNEIKTWAPNWNVVKLGNIPKRQREFAVDALENADFPFIMIINYEAWRRDAKLIDNLIRLQFDTVILDEAHNVKDRKTLAFKGINKLVYADNKCPMCASKSFRNYNYTGKKCNECEYESQDFFEFCSVRNLLPMTGTPILNRPQDLFALLNLIDKKNFNNENNFLFDYCRQDFYTKKWYFRTGGLDALVKRLSHKYVMRDRKSAGIILPPQEVQHYNLTLREEDYPEQWKAIQALNKHAMILLDENNALPVPYIIALITRKRQMMTWPEGIEFKNREGEVVLKVNVKESIKVDKVIKFQNSDRSEWTGLIPELTGFHDRPADADEDEFDESSKERVVLYSQFRAPLQEIERRCKEAGIRVAVLNGDTPADLRDEIRRDFDAKLCLAPGYETKWDVLLANYKVGGVGLNLTGASQMIILDEEWNPGKVDQAYGRIDRLGQSKETTVHVLRVNASIDTWLANLIADKAGMIEGFESKIDLQSELRKFIEGEGKGNDDE